VEVDMAVMETMMFLDLVLLYKQLLTLEVVVVEVVAVIMVVEDLE
jgi:hypothetical protein